MTDAPTRTTCPYCGVGCGVLAKPRSDGHIDIAGDPAHPANFGRLCSKGSSLGETLSLDDRLLFPQIGGRRVGWDAALDRVAEKFKSTIAEHGPESVAFYVSGQILTEDYYAANKLMKGFIGTANIDTNSRLCMASSVAGHKRAFGADTVPGCYEDLEQADLVVLVGSNLAWCHPVLFQRLVAAKEKRGTKVVVVDPRRTATCEAADMHLAIAPGSDVALFNGLLLAIAGGNATDRAYLDMHTTGFRETFKAAGQMPLREVSRVTGIAAAQLHAFYDLFVRTERVVTVFSQGVNQSSAGTDKVNAIINCHLATGRIGKAGMGPFSVTGQPNAMGGREVGGLATMLAAHMDLGDAAHRRLVQHFWASPRIAGSAGLKAVDMFRAVGDGRIKALWIMATNPVDSMPEADAVRGALKACPFVVVSDVVSDTDTTACAHVLLPALAWGEKSGTVTNSERRISRQRSFLPPPGEARADWWQIAEIGKRMGFVDAFAWTSARDVFDEYARLTAYQNSGTRDLDLGDLADLSDAAYDDLEPSIWPRGRKRFFADGKFYTPDRKGRLVATPYRAPVAVTNATWPMVLNTGRVRDQWHTMTRTAKTPRLLAHIAEPFVEVHPRDAAAHGLKAAAIARVSSRHGDALLRVLVTDRQRPGSLFAPMHWTEQVASRARIDALVAGHVDPVSGQPELKAMPVAIAPFPARWHAFALSTEKPAVAAIAYWALARARNGWRCELAHDAPIANWDAAIRDLFGIADAADIISSRDSVGQRFSCAVFHDNRLLAAFYAAPGPVAVSRGYVASKLGSLIDDPRERLGLLSGRPPGDIEDKGQIVCACFDVGANQIAARVRAGCTTLTAVGAATSAGTNCGSCRAEIGRIIDANRIAKAS